MITIKKVWTLDDKITDYTIPSKINQTIQAEGKWLLLPGIIDPHACFGKIETKEHSWEAAVASAVKGGITTAIDLPTSDLPCNDKEQLEQKRTLADKHLSAADQALNLRFYAQADLKDIEKIGLAKEWLAGILIHLEPDKTDQLDKTWERVFQMAAWQNLPIVVHAAVNGFKPGKKEALLEKAIYFAEQQNTRLYVLNVASQQEINLIQAARKRAVLIYAETTLQHLFQNDSAQSDSLWQALNDGVIETIGTGYHATRPSAEKIKFNGSSYDLLNPLFFLPLLLTACRQGKCTIERLVHLTRFNIRDLFCLPEARDVVLVDLEKEVTVQKISGNQTLDLKLKGWPVHTIVQGRVF